jgi:hypothetical protein
MDVVISEKHVSFTRVINGKRRKVIVNKEEAPLLFTKVNKYLRRHSVTSSYNLMRYFMINKQYRTEKRFQYYYIVE